MENGLRDIKNNAIADAKKIATPEQVQEVRIKYLGRKGALTEILRSIKDLPAEERRQRGEEANRLRREIEQLLDEREGELKKTYHESVLQKEWIDVTRPGVRQPRGHLHPITKIIREISDIFGRMGFAVVEGPEVETEHYNFDALNIPAEHPARDMWDTFWLVASQKVSNRQPSTVNHQRNKSQRLLLRTHTSPVQVRYMEKHNPPIRIIVPGRVYRYEATDASHDIQFYQLEGLMVDKNVSIANFKAVIQYFFSQLFKKDVGVRLRPSYFPFTEPSFEVDISCIQCSQLPTLNSQLRTRCSVCKGTAWLELAGAGMVHPNVFKAVGYNPKDAQGFAFGMGIDRLAMMKYKIPDIRLFRSSDLRFLKQF
ncbi:MAG: phenylalanine--tRNA ligase subunit alpha [Candidatus Sungbacteria bacterium]|nr:phenylalanine--tRNA ligase subunit alpha [Candidatus Sungbacteria bacterium]